MQNPQPSRAASSTHQAIGHPSCSTLSTSLFLSNAERLNYMPIFLYLFHAPRQLTSKPLNASHALLNSYAYISTPLGAARGVSIYFTHYTIRPPSRSMLHTPWRGRIPPSTYLFRYAPKFLYFSLTHHAIRPPSRSMPHTPWRGRTPPAAACPSSSISR